MSEIGRKSLQTFAVKLLVQAFGVLGAIAIARTLGAEGKGLLTYAVSTLALVVIANGQANALAWQYGKRGRPPARLVRLMLFGVLAMTVVAAGVLALVAAFVPGQSVLWWVAAALPFALFVQASSGFFLADGDVRTVNVQQMFPSVLAVAAYSALVLLAHAHVNLVLLVWTAGYAAAAAYTVARLRPYAKQQGDEPPPAVLTTRELWREHVAYAFQTGLGNLTIFLNFRIDVFIVMFVLGKGPLGIYSVGLAVGEMLWEVSRSIAIGSFGRIAKGTQERAAEATATCMRHSFALAVCGAAALSLAAPFVVPLVYGKAFAPAVAVTWALMPGVVAYSMMAALVTFFMQQLGEPRLPLLYRTLSMAICAVATIAALPRIGILGAAAATSLSYLVSFAFAAAHFVKRTGIKPSRLFLPQRSDIAPYRSIVTSALRSVARRSAT